MPQRPFVLPSGVDFYAGDGTAAGAADPLLVVSDSTNKVGINSQTPSGTLDINTASASDKGLIVRALASQTASLVEVQNSGSGILAYVGPSGVIGGSGINVNPYITPASGLAKFRSPIGNGNWVEQPVEIATYGTVAAQGINLVNGGTLSMSVSGYVAGSLAGIYYYRICPIGPNGEENPYTPAPTTANITSGTSGVVLTWTNPTTNYIPVSKWRIYRGSAGQPYTAGTAGTSNPFITTGAEATSVGTSVYFDTSDGTATSFTDTGAAGTVGFPPAMFRGPEGWLASSRGIYTPGLFTCVTQGNYTVSRSVNVNGVLFADASMNGGNSNSKIIQSYDTTWNLTNSSSNFIINNTAASAAGNAIHLAPTSGASYVSIYYAGNLRTRLAPYILDTTSDPVAVSGIAYYFNTNSALTDPRKLMSVQNNSVERFAISAYGTTTHTLGNATAKGIVLIGAASQSANLLEIQKSDSSTLYVVDSSGKLGIGSGVAPTAMLEMSAPSGVQSLLINAPSGRNSASSPIIAIKSNTNGATNATVFSMYEETTGGNAGFITFDFGPSVNTVGNSRDTKIVLRGENSYAGFTITQGVGGAPYTLISNPAGSVTDLSLPLIRLVTPTTIKTYNNDHIVQFENDTNSIYFSGGLTGQNYITLNSAANATNNGHLFVTPNLTKKGIVIKSTGVNTANLFEIQNSSSSPLLAITPSGAISGAITPTILTSTGNLTLADIHNGYIIEQTGVAGSGTFTLGTITIPTWNCMLVNIGSGVIVASGSNTMRSPGGLNKSRTQYSSISVYRRGDGSFILGGDLA